MKHKAKRAATKRATKTAERKAESKIETLDLEHPSKAILEFGVAEAAVGLLGPEMEHRVKILARRLRMSLPALVRAALEEYHNERYGKAGQPQPKALLNEVPLFGAKRSPKDLRALPVPNASRSS